MQFMGPVEEAIAASEIHCRPLPLHDDTLFHFHPVFLPFCLPCSDCYVNKCLSGTVKLKVEQKLEQMGKVQGVWLHTAHVLCMDAILSVGLEMGSHNPDCWPHVFRCMMGSPPLMAQTPPWEAWGGRQSLVGSGLCQQITSTYCSDNMPSETQGRG